MERLVHPALERLRTPVERPVGARLALSDAEIRRLAAVLDGGFDPSPPCVRRWRTWRGRTAGRRRCMGRRRRQPWRCASNR
jgi:hypothetical protein